MAEEPTEGDAFGELLASCLERGDEAEIIERDDGFIGANSAARYFAEPAAWPPLDVAAVDLCRGRVLDIGAGAARATLELARRGHEVVALDTSPGATDVCRQRGAPRAFTGDVFELAGGGGQPFDTFLMLGNNLGLLESPTAAPRFLGALAALSSPDARIVAVGTDPYATSDLVHLRYHASNRAAGRLGGQLRIRVRYRDIATPWFTYLLPTPNELAELLVGTGWRVDDLRTEDGPAYLVVLTRES